MSLRIMMVHVSAFLFLLCAVGVQAQLTGRVGPMTSLQSKQYRICNVLNYGGSIGSSDIGPAIGRAFNECVKGNPGSTLYVPAGNYNMQTWQTLNGATQWAFRMDGVITRTATPRGHMIVIQNANDFEMYSSNSAGAIQGNGYECRNAGPRLLRVVTSTNFAVHDLIFVDSPEFHIIVQEGSNGELYNLAIRGTNLGGSDGINVSGRNHWVHDVMVTNRDECICVKSPANNILVERIWCNQSGGSAIGSLGANAEVQNTVYKNVYTVGGNQAFMIKWNGGSGFCRNVLLEGFQSRGTAYGLNVQGFWSGMTPVDGNGVQLNNITFQNWNGNVADGIQRPPIQFFCADQVPCTNLVLNNVNMWSQTDRAINKCQSAYGRGGSCLRSGSGGFYAATTTTISRPPGYTNPPTLPGDLSQGFATNSPIPIPTIPSTYYPGLAQISPLMKNIGSPTTTSGGTTNPPTTTTSSGGAVQTQWGQCGGNGWTGPTQCASGFTCIEVSPPWYSQCQ